jgi:DNA-directed RNA polymerase subunit H (RpoH/RPB5)
MAVRNPAALVWTHIPEFLKSRGLEPAEPLMPLDDFMLKLVSAGHVRVNTRGKRRAPVEEDVAVALVVVSPTSDARSKGPALRKILSGFNTTTIAGPGRRDLDEVIVVVPDPTVELTNIKSTFAAFRADKDDTIRSPAGKRCAFYMYPYRVFSLNLPEAVVVGKHELLTHAETEKMLALERITLQDLPLIPQNDPPVIWAGGRPREVVKVTQASEPAMVAVSYRLVVPAGL